MTESDAKPVVVVGVDGSQSSKDALRWAANYAGLSGAEVRAVISYKTELLVAGSPNVGIAAQARETVDQAVSEVLGAKPSVPVIVDVIGGHPAQALVEASRSADLLVVGSRGHGAFAGMFLGSVSTHCVHHAKCPVLVIHHGNDHD
jgi:nucleotide-binding universal stress UspA family protein